MKLRSYLSTGVVAGSLVLAGSMALAQTATGAANAQKDKSISRQTSAQPAVVPGDSANGSAASQKKHIGNVKYNDFKVQQSVQPQTGPATSPVDAAKVKSHSNQTNNRETQPAPANGASESVKPR